MATDREPVVPTGVGASAGRVRWVAAAVLGVAFLLWLVLFAPRLLAPAASEASLRDVPDAAKRHELQDSRIKMQNDVRSTLLQGLGGLALVVGAFFTYRQVQTSRRQLEHTIESSGEQHELDRQGQVTERFTRAIDQLGHTQLDVRLGGIYALERIARDSPADRTAIREVLTAFIRSHTPWPPCLPGQYVATALISEVPELQVRAPDVHASLTVLGRGGMALREGQCDELDLHGVDLRHARLFGIHLEGANLLDAHLEEANLIAAHLPQACLADAQLEGAHLLDAHLENADLRNACLEGAKLVAANLKGANLRAAHLEGADLGKACLEGADLFDAHLEGAKLLTAHLEGADLGAANLEQADLKWAHLEGADLASASLEQAMLHNAHLERANLFGASLEGAVLHDAHLEGADLVAASLKEAHLRDAHLKEADLSEAYLEGAELDGTDLEGAKLVAANLKGANLCAASLKEAHLGGARLEGARADERTVWPTGFDLRASGVIMEGEDAAAGPPQQA